MQPVVAAHGEQADVGYHQPLCRPILVAFRVFINLLGGDDINARLRVAQKVADRNSRSDFLIALTADQRQDAFPNQFAGTLGDLINVVTVQRIGQALIFNLLQQISVVDLQHPQPRLLQIDADQRQVLTAGFRQYITRALESQGRFAILNLGGEILADAGFIAGRGGDANPRRDAVALAVANAFNAQALLGGADHRLHRRLNHQIIFKMNFAILGQIVGEEQAEFRRSAV